MVSGKYTILAVLARRTLYHFIGRRKLHIQFDTAEYTTLQALGKHAEGLI